MASNIRLPHDAPDLIIKATHVTRGEKLQGLEMAKSKQVSEPS
jgi:hypothetical protein